MNTITRYIAQVICLLPLFAVLSCSDKYKEEYVANTPIYMSYDELRDAVAFISPREMVKPGRIYFKGDTLFVVENYAGIHIFRVNDPANPERTGFLTIPGCTDLSVRNNILYANSYVDLVALDISTLSNIRETARKTEVFQYAIPATDNEHPLYGIDQTKGVVVGWEIKRISKDLKLDSEWYRYPIYDAEVSGSPGSSSGGDSFGTSGSMATFGLYDRYLYILNNYFQIDVFDVNSPNNIDKINSAPTQSVAETMFLHDAHLFLGTTTGVNVFDLKSPSSPQLKATYLHLTACDPVVIQDGYAYYTLRGGNACNNNINRLDILKLSADYLTNELVATYGMKGPYGLGIDKNTLFVCDGDAGLKVYDVTDKTKVTDNMLASFPEINAYDVIPRNGILFAVGQNGFSLYDYTDIKNIKELSSLRVFMPD